jgi:hypothetical protein
MWSFGCVMAEMVTGRIPYEGLADVDAMIRITKGDAPEMATRKVDAFLASLVKECCVLDPSKRPSARELLKRVEDELKEECAICMEKIAASGGIFCDTRAQFRCLPCLEDSLLEKLKSGVDVRADGGLECESGAGVFLLQDMRERLSAEIFKQWNAAQLKTREKILAKEYEGQIATLRLQVMDAVGRHVRHCREVIMNTLCPRCKVAIAYEGGCLAITCKNCKCGFCAFCMEDQGADAHTHCAACQHNTINRAIFPPAGRNAVTFFEEIQRARIARQIEAYLKTLPAEVAAQVRKELEK